MRTFNSFEDSNPLGEYYIPYDYDDVVLTPRQAIVKSRSQIDTTVEFGSHIFALPIIPANMSSIVDENTCIWLAERNMFYIMHRFNVDTIGFIRTMRNRGLVASVSVGIKESDYELVNNMKTFNLAPEYITVDVAHGDSLEVVRMVEHIKETLPETFIIAGNIGTLNGANNLIEAGANALKIGLGPGIACLTTPNTGFGTKGHQLSTVQAIAEMVDNEYEEKIFIIADGGIRNSGDIAKSIALGAHMVMIGGMLSGHDENPGEITKPNPDDPTTWVKTFYGSASAEQKGNNKHVEGRSMLVPYKGSLETTLQTLKENLQSSISYAGGDELAALQHVTYVLFNQQD